MTRLSIPLAAALCLVLTHPVGAEPYHNETWHFTIDVPPGWKPIPDAELDAFADLANERMGDRAPKRYLTGFRPKGPGTYPYLLLTTTQGSTRGMSLDDLRRELAREWTPVANGMKEGFPDALVDATVAPAIPLDTMRNRFLVRTQTKVAGVGPVTGMTYGYVGADGVVAVHIYVEDRKMAAELRTLTQAADSFRWDVGYEFRPRVGGTDWRRPVLYVLVGFCAVAGAAVAILFGLSLIRPARGRQHQSGHAAGNGSDWVQLEPAGVNGPAEGREGHAAPAPQPQAQNRPILVGFAVAGMTISTAIAKEVGKDFIPPQPGGGLNAFELLLAVVAGGVGGLIGGGIGALVEWLIAAIRGSDTGRRELAPNRLPERPNGDDRSDRRRPSPAKGSLLVTVLRNAVWGAVGLVAASTAMLVAVVVVSLAANELKANQIRTELPAPGWFFPDEYRPALVLGILVAPPLFGGAVVVLGARWWVGPVGGTLIGLAGAAGFCFFQVLHSDALAVPVPCFAAGLAGGVLSGLRRRFGI